MLTRAWRALAALVALGEVTPDEFRLRMKVWDHAPPECVEAEAMDLLAEDAMREAGW